VGSKGGGNGQRWRRGSLQKEKESGTTAIGGTGKITGRKTLHGRAKKRKTKERNHCPALIFRRGKKKKILKKSIKKDNVRLQTHDRKKSIWGEKESFQKGDEGQLKGKTQQKLRARRESL